MSAASQPEKFAPLPSRPAPRSTTGAVGWLRANLLSSPLNIGLTLMVVYALLQIVPPAFQWMFVDAVWSGEDSAVCKPPPTPAKSPTPRRLLGLHQRPAGANFCSDCTSPETPTSCGVRF